MLYVLFLFGMALAEEWLWEYLIWENYHDVDEDWFAGLLHFVCGLCNRLSRSSCAIPVNVFDFNLSPRAESALVALLALPQVTHYWLDAFIWKMDGSNAGLREALFPPPKGD